MDINSILSGVKCSCGKFHACDIEHVFVESGAINHLTELCISYSNILLVADENTLSACGDKVEKALKSNNLTKIIFTGKTVLIPNEDAINTVTEKLSGIDLIIGVGSGVIQDLCKYVAHFNSLPYMVVATAPSMDGYASTGAAMILNGMKETVSATLPRAIIADTEVLRNAPMEMIKAGYGDIIGKYSALNDWLLSNLVNGEYLCEYIYNTTFDMIKETLKTAKGLLNRDEQSVKALTEALLVVGIMMSFATTSRPASGSEHHLSHFFEISGIVNSQPYFPHGIDVAYSTVITAKIRSALIGVEFPNQQFKPQAEAYEKDLVRLYGPVAKGCMALQKRLGTYERDRVSIYKNNEEKIKEILGQMPRDAEILDMLSLVELDIKEFYDLYGKDKIKDAITYAKDLKDRYTVLWLYYDLFGDRNEINL